MLRYRITKISKSLQSSLRHMITIEVMCYKSDQLKLLLFTVIICIIVYRVQGMNV